MSLGSWAASWSPPKQNAHPLFDVWDMKDLQEYQPIAYEKRGQGPKLDYTNSF
jgi:hypothetical protein